MNYGKTKITTTYPWGLMRKQGSRLLCSDGKIRAPHYLASTPDTFFSTPCAMRVRGKYITGYMTTEEQRWIAGEKTTNFLRAIVFRQHTGQGDALPPWPDDDHKINALIASAHED